MEKTIYPSTATIVKTAVLAIFLVVAALFGLGCGSSQGNIPVAVSPDLQDIEILNRKSAEPANNESDRKDHESYKESERDTDEGSDLDTDEWSASVEPVVITVAEFEQNALAAYNEAYALYAEYNRMIFGTDNGPGVKYTVYGEVAKLSKEDAKLVEKNYKRAESLLMQAEASAMGVVASSDQEISAVNQSLKLMYRFQKTLIFEYVYHVKRHLPDENGPFITIYDYNAKINPAYARAKTLYAEAVALMNASGGNPSPEDLAIINANYLSAIETGLRILSKVDTVDKMEDWYDHLYLTNMMQMNAWTRNISLEYCTTVKPLL